MAQITVEEVANTAINLVVDDCLKEAKENWSKSQVEMLERLFECCKEGCPYKCVGCTYFGIQGDAPETAQKDCLWEPNEEDADGYIIQNRPCEDD